MTLGDLRKVACVVKCQLYLNCGSSNTLHGLFAKTLGGQNFVGKCRSPTEISWEGAHFISRMDQSGFFSFFFPSSSSSSSFKYSTHPNGCEKTMVFICISPMITDVEHLFMCLLAICLSSVKRCLFKFFAHV